MIEQGIKISLMILGVHVILKKGNVLGEVQIFFANIFDRILSKKWSIIIQKPLWSCFTCMASVWGIIFTLPFDITSQSAWIGEIKILLFVCGLNYFIDQIIPDGKDS